MHSVILRQPGIVNILLNWEPLNAHVSPLFHSLVERLMAQSCSSCQIVVDSQPGVLAPHRVVLQLPGGTL